MTIGQLQNEMELNDYSDFYHRPNTIILLLVSVKVVTTSIQLTSDRPQTLFAMQRNELSKLRHLLGHVRKIITFK